jgi:hypothetical protein
VSGVYVCQYGAAAAVRNVPRRPTALKEKHTRILVCCYIVLTRYYTPSLSMVVRAWFRNLLQHGTGTGTTIGTKNESNETRSIVIIARGCRPGPCLPCAVILRCLVLDMVDWRRPTLSTKSEQSICPYVGCRRHSIS